MTKTCSWCHRSYAARDTKKKGGTTQSFCSTGCRQHFHSAARRLGQMILASGGPNIEALARWLSCGGNAHVVATGALSENGITFSVHAGKTVNLATEGAAP